LTTLFHIVFRGLKNVAYELKTGCVVEVTDGEDRFENTIQTIFTPSIGIHVLSARKTRMSFFAFQ
jgi:hypothetical protein